jgi:AcrR family transcriptional regulator
MDAHGPQAALGVPGRKSTKASLIDVAEKFFGTHGLEGSSLREIAAAAGQRNYNAVQYHFGSKRGLINAILDVRFREVDEIRKKLIAARYADADIAALSVSELLRLIWEPVFFIAHSGVSDFCRFQLQYRLNSYEADHPFYALDESSVLREAISRDQSRPSMYKVAEALRNKLPHLDEASFHKRTATIGYMFLCFVVEQDNARLRKGSASAEPDFELILEMMTAALSVPV